MLTGRLERLRASLGGRGDVARYGAAVMLSITSSVLGLGRELLLLSWFGLSAQNDRLQLHLSIIYTVSLLGESVRLASLNVLARHGLGSMVTVSAAAATTTSVAVTVAFAWHMERPELSLLLVAAIGGAANLVAVTLLVHRQRHARFLPTHAVTVAPNILIFVGLVIVRLTGGDVVTGVLWLFASAPFLQIIALACIRPIAGQAPANAGGSARAALSDGFGALALHSTSAVGTQVGQVLIRGGLSMAAPGALSLYAILARVFDTARAVFVDSFIGSRIAGWAAGRSAIPRLLNPAAPPAPLFIGVAIAAVLGVQMVGGGRIELALAYVLLLAAGFYMSSIARVGYYFRNAVGMPRRLVAAFGAADGVLALLALAIARFGERTGAALTILALYAVVRPMLQIVLLRWSTADAHGSPYAVPRVGDHAS